MRYIDAKPFIDDPGISASKLILLIKLKVKSICSCHNRAETQKMLCCGRTYSVC